jgi:predicted lipoprotein
MSAAVDAFCESPSDTGLTRAQESWVEAKRAWERSEISVYYGPATMLRTKSKVDFEPISPAGIDDLVASDTVIDFDYVDNRSAASRRGLGAVEYALYRPLAEAGDPRLCELTVSASAVAAAATEELREAWSGGTDPFRRTFTTTMTANDALSDVVGAQHETLTRQTLFELGAALGVTAADPDPSALVEGPAQMGVNRLLAQLDGIEETMSAGGDTSLIELIRSRSADVAETIETTLANGIAGLESVDGPLSAAVTEDPRLMNEVLDDLSRLRDTINVDVVSLLDLTLGFSDSDGDTG